MLNNLIFVSQVIAVILAQLVIGGIGVILLLAVGTHAYTRLAKRSIKLRL